MITLNKCQIDVSFFNQNLCLKCFKIFVFQKITYSHKVCALIKINQRPHVARGVKVCIFGSSMFCNKYNFRNIAIIMQPCIVTSWTLKLMKLFLNTCLKKYTEMIILTSENFVENICHQSLYLRMSFLDSQICRHNMI